MSAYNHGRPSWIDPDFYPVEEYLFKQDFPGDPNTQPVTLVDVGGGIGHDLEKLLSRFPEAPGRFVLQELPIVIEQARGNTLNRNIELMEYDFFTEQSVKGTVECSMLCLLVNANTGSKVPVHIICTPFFTIGPMRSVHKFYRFRKLL
jgi:hypothetical protein